GQTCTAAAAAGRTIAIAQLAALELAIAAVGGGAGDPLATAAAHRAAHLTVGTSFGHGVAVITLFAALHRTVAANRLRTGLREGEDLPGDRQRPHPRAGTGVGHRRVADCAV